ncbi:PIN domain-containing protein [Dorea longicatena]|uniref:PIN domain-containing protein n=1 Tax=Dorea longicatena TaxID=88431 RepID=UPI003F88D412
MIKSYVIDTNILIQAPYACQCFEENRVILPLVVLEELDGLKKAEGKKPVVLVTKDLVLRLKAQILGIEAQDFSTEQVIEEEGQYSGRQICYVAEDKFKEFKKKGVHLKELYLSDEDGNKIQPELTENEFIISKADQSVKKTHLGRVEGKKVVSLEFRESVLY